ncbi:MAG: hypothetical protein BWY99_00346 [Synergistetes bacterium ADurb.BinA166]|nr:MAG: hypothetical protein BWY99_00346 [Synergistetes bacterium ADurb.BinA166]
MTVVTPLPAAVPDDMEELIRRMQAVMKVRDDDETFQEMRKDIGRMSCGYVVPGAAITEDEARGPVFEVPAENSFGSLYKVRDAAELGRLCGLAEERLASFTVRTSGLLDSLVESLVDSKFRRIESLRTVADESAPAKTFNLETVRAYARLTGSVEQVTISCTRGVVLIFRCGEDEAVRRMEHVRELKPTPLKTLVKMAAARLSAMARAERAWRVDHNILDSFKAELPALRKENLPRYVRAAHDVVLWGGTTDGLKKAARDLSSFLQRPDVGDEALEEAFRLLAVEEVMGS